MADSDSLSFVAELAGERMMNQCKENGEEPTTKNNGCADWQLLYTDAISCDNANKIDGLETMRGKDQNDAVCLWIDYKQISTDDARWL